MNKNFKIWFIWGELWSTDSFPIEIFGVLICVKEWKKKKKKGKGNPEGKLMELGEGPI